MLKMDQKIDPSKVVGLFQLHAALLVALILIIFEFLYFGSAMPDAFERIALVMASIIFVPCLIGFMLFMQIKYRAHFFDNPTYSDYITKNEGDVVRLPQSEDAKVVISSGIHLPIAPAGLTEISREIWSQDWKISINVMHPERREIRSALQKEGILIEGTFGKEERIPNDWVISFNESISITSVFKFMLIIFEFKIDGMNFWQPVRDAGEEEDVYIGSFGTQRFVRLDAEIKKTLEQRDAFEFAACVQKRKA